MKESVKGSGKGSVKESGKESMKKRERKFNMERMPHLDSFTLFICGSMAAQPAICNGYKI